MHGQLHHSSGQPLFALLWKVRIQPSRPKRTVHHTINRALCQRQPKKVLELEDLHRESLRAADILDHPRQDAAFDSDDEASGVLDKKVATRHAAGASHMQHLYKPQSYVASFSRRSSMSRSAGSVGSEGPAMRRGRAYVLASMSARSGAMPAEVLPDEASIELAPVPEGAAVTRPGTKPIPGGALDYSYIKGPEDSSWLTVIKEVVLPALVLVVGVANAVITLATIQIE